MNYFEEIIIKLKKELNLTTDKELYEYMGIMQGTFTNWRRRNSIPYEQIITICFNEKLDLNYIFSNKELEKTSKNDRKLSKTQKEILTKLNNLDPIQQKIILNKIDEEIIKNEEKEIEILKNSILKCFDNINSTHRIILEEFERDEETLKAVYIDDDWNLDLKNETYVEDNKKSFVELLKMLLENIKENK
jgi:hypothetical protein